MIRTQVQFTTKQMRDLRAMARRRGLSVAALVRQAVDGLLESQEEDRSDRWSRAASLIGRFEDREAATDLAEEHDEYLEDAFE